MEVFKAVLKFFVFVISWLLVGSAWVAFGISLRGKNPADYPTYDLCILVFLWPFMVLGIMYEYFTKFVAELVYIGFSFF